VFSTVMIMHVIVLDLLVMIVIIMLRRIYWLCYSDSWHRCRTLSWLGHWGIRQSTVVCSEQILAFDCSFIVPLRPTVAVCPPRLSVVHPFILLPRCFVNGLSNLDETYREYSLAPTSDLFRLWRSKVKVTAGHQDGEGIHIDTVALKSI